MLYRSFFPRDLFSEFDRLQRELSRGFGMSANIRGGPRSYPAMNVGTTPKSVEIYVFAPGMDPADLEVKIEKGLLTLSGERKDETVPESATVHIDERFAGRFRRVVSLPDDVNPDEVTARYRDGVLHVSVARREAAQARRINVQ